jgi:acyl-homoserine-lactone acylase
MKITIITTLTSKVVLFSCVFLTVVFQSHSQDKQTEIIWDNYGVPHIVARSVEEMYYSFGWAQMHNHANLVIKLYGQARGRAAEYWGEEYLASDKQVHLFNLPETARRNYTKQDNENKKYLDAFVNGINAFASAHPGDIDPSMKRVLPIAPSDVLAHSSRVICLEFLARDDIRNVKKTVTPGSNAYAVAPSRSATKNAMLVSNPHLPWSDFFLFFEAHLTAPGFQAYGASLVGQPVLNIAFNNYLGWTHTVNTIDGSDTYELTLRNGGYLLDDVVQSFVKRVVPIKIRLTDGGFKLHIEEFLVSKHGPVIGQKNDKAYAIRVAGLENAFLGAQFHKMAQAENWKEFESALQMSQLPMFNVIYADKSGNICYFFNGNVPIRGEGDWLFWKGPIDGSSSKYIWHRYHSYDDLPKVFNPSMGFVQNANDPPWSSTYPPVLDPSNFPGYMSPLKIALRPQRAIKLIKDDMDITFDELVGYKLNTGMEAADRFLDDLLTAVQKYPNPVALKAAAVLQTWDKATNVDSKGAVLFAQWFDKINETMFMSPWDNAHSIATPDGLKDSQEAVALLVQAANELENTYGSLDIAWGDVNRFKIGNFNFPGNGGPGSYGIYRAINFSRDPKDNKSYAVAGDSYVAIIEFGSKVKAQVLLSYGNATQPGNKHIGDQLQLLSQKKLRPALLDKNEIIQNMEEREALSIKLDSN